MHGISTADRVVILVEHGFDDAATAYLYTYLRQASIAVSIVGPNRELVTGHWGLTLRPHLALIELMPESACPLLILPGLPVSINRLFQSEEVRVWVRSVLEGNYVAATATAEPALQGIDFPNWQEHFVRQGKLPLPQFAQLLVDHVWETAAERPQTVWV